MATWPAWRLAWAGVLTLAWVQAWGQAGVLDVQVLGANGAPLEHAAVYLEVPGDPATSAPDPVRIVQRERRFVPPVTVVRTGTPVQFPNEDTVRHHVYSFSPAKTFELKLYIGTPAEPVVFDQAGTAVLGCNIHDRMIAWVHVVDTPHFARTDAQGRARLEGLPHGAYRLRVWHPGLPERAPVHEEPVALSGQPLAVTLRLAATGLPTP